MTYTEKLPPLPEPAYVSHDIPLFSSFQMMDYAQAALDALADEAEASIKEMIDAGLGQLPKQEPVAWQAVGGSIWGHKTSEDDRPLYTEGNWNEGYKHGLWQGQNCAKPTTIAEWWAEKQTASGEPDMKHPKIQALIGGKARREIELQIVEQLLDDPDCDLSAMDMEYWHGLHDKLREKLTAALAQPAPDAVPVAWALCPTDIYDFAGWLTTRPGTLVVGSSHKAGPMAEAVGEYLRKFPDRFAAHPQPAPLTDEQIDQITAEQWGRGLGAPYAAYRAYARAIEAACGITAKEAP